ncbi:MAG: hypothetical protein MSG78_04355 [Clostridiales bacterium]|nr:hypothetical protein [Clostridiales bacterium]
MKKRIFIMLVLAMVTVAAITGCGNMRNGNTGTNSMKPTNGTNENTTMERDYRESDGMNSTSRDNNGTNSVSTDNNASRDNNNRSSDGVVGDVLTDAANGVKNIGNDIESAMDGTNASETVTTDTTNTQRSSGY